MLLMTLVLILGVNVSVLLYLAWTVEDRKEKLKKEIKQEVLDEVHLILYGGNLNEFKQK